MIIKGSNVLEARLDEQEGMLQCLLNPRGLGPRSTGEEKSQVSSPIGNELQSKAAREIING